MPIIKGPIVQNINRSGSARSKTTSPYHVVCIGASAGGFRAVLEIIEQLPPDLNAAVFVLLHISRSSKSEILVEKIRKHTGLSCSVAQNNETIRPGHIYIAPPDVHLLVKKDQVILGHGPQENRFRPSIDVLFRSAAVAYGEQAIGIVLTGYLSDGTNGMWAIKQCGGHSIVQDPGEAEYPDMPVSVLDTMEVDYSIPLREMGEVITSIITANIIKGIEPPANIIAESHLSESAATGIEGIDQIGDRSVYSCPDCGGNLWEMQKGGVKHYRCHIGHSYSEKDLALKQTVGIDHTMWIAVRMMEERRSLLVKMAKENTNRAAATLNERYQLQIDELENHIGKIKNLLFKQQ